MAQPPVVAAVMPLRVGVAEAERVLRRAEAVARTPAVEAGVAQRRVEVVAEVVQLPGEGVAVARTPAVAAAVLLRVGVEAVQPSVAEAAGVPLRAAVAVRPAVVEAAGEPLRLEAVPRPANGCRTAGPHPHRALVATGSVYEAATRGRTHP